MNKIIVRQSVTECNLSTEEIKIICYADGAVLIAENEHDLQLLLAFHNICQQFNIEISTSKTKSIVISREPIRCKLIINNEIIPQITTFQYCEGRNVITPRQS